MATIFHIAERPFWELALRSGRYRVPSLDAEGFIHLSTPNQFVATANRYYSGRSDLVLLEVEESFLDPESLRYERSTNDELFPHLYAELPVDAVRRVHAFLPDADGVFTAPPTISA